jgi:hypothetical protein
MPDGKQIVFPGNQPGHEVRCFIQNIDGGKPRPITPEGVGSCRVSPDGQLLVGEDLTGGGARFYPMDGGPPRAIPGLLPGETLAWSPDPHFLYVPVETSADQGLPLERFERRKATFQRNAPPWMRRDFATWLTFQR